MTDKISINTDPLCVDLDGTLLRSDILLESILVLIRKNILYFFLMPFWLLKGKAYFKYKIAEKVELDVGSLPYQAEFLEFLKKVKAEGRKLYLATASNEKFASQIAEHLGIFEGVFASDSVTNLSGKNKRKALVESFGEKQFAYAGNALVDLKIWVHSSEIVIVNPKLSVVRNARKIGAVSRIFSNKIKLPKTYFKALRCHQWTKNALIFVPLLMSHNILDLNLFLQAFVAFISFGFCASSVYILNDLLDLRSDRLHATKCLRPFASGDLTITTGFLLIPMLLAGSVACALYLPLEFVGILGLYYSITVAYSFGLKDASLLDILLLAGLYTIRILAGAAAISVTPSFWLLAFSMFIFFSLASVKRYAELLNLKGKTWARGYQIVDLDTLAQIGISSGLLSVLVMALYINSEPTTELYSQPEIIWLICPLLLYWISRIWLLTRRGLMNEDPVVYAIKDYRSHVIAVVCLAILWLAI